MILPSLAAEQERIVLALGELRRQEQELSNDIKSLLVDPSNPCTHDVTATLHDLSEMLPDWHQLKERGLNLASTIEDGHATSDRVCLSTARCFILLSSLQAYQACLQVSGAVRRLDDAQARVQEVLNLTKEVLQLRSCCKEACSAVSAGDLVGGVSCVLRYKKLDSSALKRCYPRDVDAMIAVKECLAKDVLARFEECALDLDEEGVAQYGPLLGPLDKSYQGTEPYLGFASRLLHCKLEASEKDDAAAKVKASQDLSTLYNTCAAFVQQQLSITMRGLAEGDDQVGRGDVRLLQLVHGECCKKASNLIDHYLKFSGAADAAATRPSPERLGEADARLEELALLLQHSESYSRFVQHLASRVTTYHPVKGVILPVRTPLDEAVAEVSMLYGQMELHLLKASLIKALEIDEITPGTDDSGIQTSCVEDAFFVAQRCATRALATGHAGSASAVINHVANTVTGELLETLQSKVKVAANIDRVTKSPALLQLHIGDLKNQLQGIQSQGIQGMGSISINWEEVGSNLATDISTLGTSATAALNQAQMSLSRQGRSSRDKGSDGPGEGAAARVGRSLCLAYLNDMEACGQYVIKLKNELSAQVKG
ncbi:unnamed protein product [Chrysoparadoxa australica]